MNLQKAIEEHGQEKVMMFIQGKINSLKEDIEKREEIQKEEIQKEEIQKEEIQKEEELDLTFMYWTQEKK